MRWSLDQSCQAAGEHYEGCKADDGDCVSMAKRNDGCWSVAADPEGGAVVGFMSVIEARRPRPPPPPSPASPP